MQYPAQCLGKFALRLCLRRYNVVGSCNASSSGIGNNMSDAAQNIFDVDPTHDLPPTAKAATQTEKKREPHHRQRTLVAQNHAKPQHGQRNSIVADWVNGIL